MSFDVRFSKVAKLQLTEITDFIALDNPLRAISFARELQQKALDISKSTFVYPHLVSHPQFRKKSYKGYIILYKVEENIIIISHIINPVRDYSKLLK